MPGGVKTEAPKEVRTYQMYINNEWVDSKSTKTGREPSKRIFSGVASLRIQPSWSNWLQSSSVSSPAATHCPGVHSQG